MISRDFPHVFLLILTTIIAIVNISFVQCVIHFHDDSDYSSNSSEDGPSYCTTIRGSNGRCKPLSHCPPGQWSGSYRDVCSSGRYDKIVCCKERKMHNSHRRDRTRDRWNSVTRDEHPDYDTMQTEIKPKTKRISEQKFEEYMDRIFSNRSLEDNAQGRVPTMPGQYPHMSALGWILESKEIDWKCGGNLISEYFVLTAAHCASVNGKNPDVVKIGDLNLVEREDSVLPQTFRVKRIHMHPMYDSTAYYNDIGLIELFKKAIFTEFVRPACLWSEQNIPHSIVVAMGYGSSEFGGIQTKTLSELTLSIMPNEECNTRLPPIPAASLGVIDNQICAIDPSGRTDTCQGDSGGPLQMNVMKHGKPYYYLVGITSYGIFCGGKYPSVYTRIASFVDWIEQLVWPL